MKYQELIKSDARTCLYLIKRGEFKEVSIDETKLSTQSLFLVKKIKNKLYCEPDSQLNEHNILRQLSHPNIIKTYGYDSKDRGIYLDYVNGIDLLDYLRTEVILSEFDIYKIFKQLAAAVHHCHKNNIAHRDLKLENAMIENNKNIILLDFECACVLDENKSTRIEKLCGTIDYFSPELMEFVLIKRIGRQNRYYLLEEKVNKNYNPLQADIWSLGIMLYEMLLREISSDSSSTNSFNDNQGHIYANIITSPGFCFWKNKKNSELKELLSGLLNPDPAKRYDIHDVLNSRWMCKFRNVENKLNKGENHNERVIIIKNNTYYELNYKELIKNNVEYSTLYFSDETKIAKNSYKKSCIIL